MLRGVQHAGARRQPELCPKEGEKEPHFLAVQRRPHNHQRRRHDHLHTTVHHKRHLLRLARTSSLPLLLLLLLFLSADAPAPAPAVAPAVVFVFLGGIVTVPPQCEHCGRREDRQRVGEGAGRGGFHWENATSAATPAETEPHAVDDPGHAYRHDVVTVAQAEQRMCHRWHCQLLSLLQMMMIGRRSVRIGLPLAVLNATAAVPAAATTYVGDATTHRGKRVFNYLCTIYLLN